MQHREFIIRVGDCLSGQLLCHDGDNKVEGGNEVRNVRTVRFRLAFHALAPDVSEQKLTFCQNSNLPQFFV